MHQLVQVHRLQRLKHSLRLLLNQLLMLCESARRNHQLADALHLLIAQLGIAQAIVQKRRILLIEGGGGERHQNGTLTLTQVIAGGLTGYLGLTEDAQLVITQLEALTQRQTKRAVTDKYRVLLAHSTGAVLQRGSLQSQSATNREGVLARVLGGLETNHVQGTLQSRLSVLGFENLGVDVQVLARQNLGAHPVKNSARGGAVDCPLTQGRENLGRPRQGQISRKNTAGQTVVESITAPAILLVRRLETLVHGGCAAAGIGAVDNVVVNQRGGLEQLHRHARLHNRPGRAVLGDGCAACTSPTPVAQQGTQALAAGGEGLNSLQQG